MVGVTACKGKVEVEEKREVSLGTGVASTDELNTLSRAVVRAIKNSAPQFNITSHENPNGTSEVLKNVARYDLCGLSLDEAAHAYYGFFQWEGRPHPQLRLLFIMGILPITFIVAADSGIESIYDLKGKPFGSGSMKNEAEFKVMKLLETLNITPKWNRDPWTTQVDLYKEGELVGFLHCGAVEPILLQCAEHRPFAILELPETELSRVRQRYAGTGLTYHPCMVRSGTYPHQSEHIKTFGLMLGYFTRQDVPAEVGYWAVKAAWAEVWNLSASYGPLKFEVIRFPKLTLEYGPFPLHQGAVKVYEEIGLKVPDRLLPPEIR